jgi:hypothetical protein
MNLWEWKRTTRLEGEQPVAAIRSSTAEATVPAAPVDVAVSERPVGIADPERLPAFTLPPAGVSLERSFCQDGFVVVPQVFDQTEIAEIRRAAIAEFPNNRGTTRPAVPDGFRSLLSGSVIASSSAGFVETQATCG